MDKLLLVSVFWKSREEEEDEDATVCVEDGVAVYITQPDGLEVRLLITELEQVYHFALKQIHRREGVDAVAHVEDALILYLTRPDGLQVRLTVYELELLQNFVKGEVFRQEEEESATDLANEDLTGRIAGCQSTDHTECYGELWECANCGKIVCCNEGSSNDPGLCDDCWVIQQGSQKEDDGTAVVG